MPGVPVSRHGSVDKPESMREITYGKSLVDSCPLRVEMSRFPLVGEARKRSSHKRKSLVSQMKLEGLILPSIRDQKATEDSTPVLQKSTEKEFQEFDSCYKPSQPMGYSKKIVFAGPSACQTDFKNFTKESLEVIVERKQEKLEESNALKRWEFWMDDKRRMQDYLGKRLQKNSGDLLLQDSDKIRRELEEKWLRTYTQIPEADRWRGHPFRWKAELRLPNNKIKWNQPRVCSPGEYCAVQTRLDKGEVPETEFIGIPQTIQKEKGLSFKSRATERQYDLLKAEETHFFTKRMKQLKPHDIDMDALEVIGKKIIQTKEIPEKKNSDRELPQILVQDTGDHNRCEEDPSVFCLIIGKEKIRYEIQGLDCRIPQKTFHWKVDFALNTVESLAQRVLRVENQGTMAIRYHWLSEKPEQPMNLEKMHPRQYEPWFFFNKNSGFFLPGQIYHLKFYHYSKFSGIRKEVWHLKTEPPLTLSSDPCTVTLSAIATEEFSSSSPPLETYLYNRVKVSIVENMIEIILEKVLRPNSLRGIEYRSLFSNKILFEHNNPKRYYNSTIVNGLKKIYEENTPGLSDWDLSLDTLVSQVKARRIGKERNSLLFQIAEKANLLFKPTYVSASQDNKYRMTYAILCKMTNHMEEDYNFFRSSVSHKINRSLKKTNSEYRRSIAEKNYPSTEVEEYGELEYYNILNFEINPTNFLFFKTMFYIKVYYRICQAVEHIAGVLETRKLFEPWKKINYKLEKPARNDEGLPFVPNFTEFWK